MKIKQEQILNELLVMRTQSGDTEAFTLLVKRWQPAFLKQAYRLTRDRNAAMDVVQESWYAISKGIGNLRSTSAFKIWAYRIVSNKSVNWVRSQQRTRVLGVEQDYEVQKEYNQEDNDAVDIVKMALARLPRDSRTILAMFYIDDYSVSEIADILNLKEGTVKSRLFYARKGLKEKIESFKQ